MRCPQCGTHNEPDSRFCGGCGARLAGQLAPTQKISDAQYTPGPVPQPTTLQRQPPPPNSASQPVTRAASGQQAPIARPSSAPQPVQQRQPSAPQPVSRPSAPSVPPIGQRQPRAQSVPPVSNGVSVRPARGSLSGASQSLTPARGRPWGVIVVVLVIDLALAAAGGWMLSQGLADPPAAPAAGSAAKTGSTSPKAEAIGTITPAAAPKPAAPSPPSAVMPAVAPEPAPAAAKPRPSPAKARKRPSGRPKAGSGPLDPYAEPAPPGPPLPPYPPPPPLPEPLP